MGKQERQKPGPKPKPRDKVNTANIAAWITEEDYRLFAEWAREMNQTISERLRLLIRHHLSHTRQQEAKAKPK